MLLLLLLHVLLSLGCVNCHVVCCVSGSFLLPSCLPKAATLESCWLLLLLLWAS
jgi:hypothetical protein